MEAVSPLAGTAAVERRSRCVSAVANLPATLQDAERHVKSLTTLCVAERHVQLCDNAPQSRASY
eukprot:6346162-Prymnesium_polylepis.1